MTLATPLARLGLTRPAWPLPAVALCLALVTAIASVPTAPAQDMFSAEDMQEMMEAMGGMQEMMEDLDPESREMIDQMMSNPPAGIGSVDDGGQPARDDAKLAAISTAALGAGGLKAYIEALQPKINAAIRPEARKRAELINTELAKSGDYLPQLRAAANGLAAWGALPEATWLMGKAALASGDAQDLSNLAAFLSMLHAEPAALPILYTLDARYPGNSTILNNLGQARYGLGDIAEAEKFLIAAAGITPLHPQANMTIARIQAARGDNQAAQASLHKALQGGFSNAKEEQLRKAGGKLNADDVRWRRPLPQDPLGLEKFNIPAYPMGATELVTAEPQWREFKAMTAAMVSGLDQKAKEYTDSMNNQSQAALMKSTVSSASSPYMLKASTLMGIAAETYELDLKRQAKPRTEAMLAHGNALAVLREKIFAIKMANDEKFAPNIPPPGYDCPEIFSEIDKYLTEYNSEYETLNRDWLNSYRRFLNETTYLAQYTSPTPEMFEATKLGAKSGYAQALRDLPVALVDGIVASETTCYSGAGMQAAEKTELSDFHCEYISTLSMGELGSIVSRCDVTEANFGPSFAPFKASWATEIRNDNSVLLTRASAEVSIDGVTVGGHSEFDAGGMKSGGLSVGAGADLGPKLKGGPLEIGVKVGVTAGFEFDRGGITDVGLTAGVNSKASSTIGDTGMAKSESSVKAGVESSWSWNSGFGGGSSAGFDTSVF